jgi:hypothetical protein
VTCLPKLSRFLAWFPDGNPLMKCFVARILLMSAIFGTLVTPAAMAHSYDIAIMNDRVIDP